MPFNKHPKQQSTNPPKTTKVADGAPSENLYACDLRPEFTSLGYDLFLDASTLKTHFFAADIFDASPTSPLSALDSQIDILNTSSFFHLFTLPQQKEVAARVTKLLRKTPGSLIVGRQAASVVAGNMENKVRNDGAEVWRHNVESWEGMWREVGEEAGVEWECETLLTQRPEWTARGLGDEGTRVMKFAVRMV